MEVGSGSIGLAEFLRHPFVGCDVDFVDRPREAMRPLKCSAARLPFANQSFDAVVVSDVIEHIPPDLRATVISEALRVSRAVAVIGFPCGSRALDTDVKLRESYLKRKMVPPVWLDEHVKYPFPEENLFSSVPPGWKARIIPNESLNFHYAMMRMEMYRPLNYLFRAGLRVIPKIMEWFLQRVDVEPSYRKIFVLCRQ